MNEELSELELLYPQLFEVLNSHSEKLKKLLKLNDFMFASSLILFVYLLVHHFNINLVFVFSILNNIDLNTAMKDFVCVFGIELFVLIVSFLFVFFVIKTEKEIKIKEATINLLFYFCNILSPLLFIFLVEMLGLFLFINDEFLSMVAFSHFLVIIFSLVISIPLFDYIFKLTGTIEKELKDELLIKIFNKEIIKPTFIV